MQRSYIHKHIHMYIHTCKPVHACNIQHTHTYIHTYIHAYIPTYMILHVDAPVFCNAERQKTFGSNLVAAYCYAAVLDNIP